MYSLLCRRRETLNVWPMVNSKDIQVETSKEYNIFILEVLVSYFRCSLGIEICIIQPTLRNQSMPSAESTYTISIIVFKTIAHDSDLLLFCAQDWKGIFWLLVNDNQRIWRTTPKSTGDKAKRNIFEGFCINSQFSCVSNWNAYTLHKGDLGGV